MNWVTYWRLVVAVVLLWVTLSNWSHMKTLESLVNISSILAVRLTAAEDEIEHLRLKMGMNPSGVSFREGFKAKDDTIR